MHIKAQIFLFIQAFTDLEPLVQLATGDGVDIEIANLGCWIHEVAREGFYYQTSVRLVWASLSKDPGCFFDLQIDRHSVVPLFWGRH